MERKIKGTIEAILFAAGKEVNIKDIALIIEKSKPEIEEIVQAMNKEYKDNERGLEIVQIEDSWQLATNKDYSDAIYKIIDKRNKPKLSTAALETLSIIAYNPRISRAEIEGIRGVNVDGTMYKLLEYGLIEEAGKLDLPGKPMSYKTTNEFLRLFGYKSLKDLPELPRYELDSNGRIVIDELQEMVEENSQENQKEENEVIS